MSVRVIQPGPISASERFGLPINTTAATGRKASTPAELRAQLSQTQAMWRHNQQQIAAAGGVCGAEALLSAASAATEPTEALAPVPPAAEGCCVTPEAAAAAASDFAERASRVAAEAPVELRFEPTSVASVAADAQEYSLAGREASEKIRGTVHESIDDLKFHVEQGVQALRAAASTDATQVQAALAQLQAGVAALEEQQSAAQALHTRVSEATAAHLTDAQAREGILLSRGEEAQIRTELAQEAADKAIAQHLLVLEAAQTAITAANTAAEAAHTASNAALTRATAAPTASPTDASADDDDDDDTDGSAESMSAHMHTMFSMANKEATESPVATKCKNGQDVTNQELAEGIKQTVLKVGAACNTGFFFAASEPPASEGPTPAAPPKDEPPAKEEPPPPPAAAPEPPKEPSTETGMGLFGSGGGGDDLPPLQTTLLIASAVEKTMQAATGLSTERIAEATRRAVDELAETREVATMNARVQGHVSATADAMGVTRGRASSTRIKALATRAAQVDGPDFSERPVEYVKAMATALGLFRPKGKTMDEDMRDAGVAISRAVADSKLATSAATMATYKALEGAPDDMDTRCKMAAQATMGHMDTRNYATGSDYLKASTLAAMRGTAMRRALYALMMTSDALHASGMLE